MHIVIHFQDKVTIKYLMCNAVNLHTKGQCHNQSLILENSFHSAEQFI